MKIQYQDMVMLYRHVNGKTFVTTNKPYVWHRSCKDGVFKTTPFITYKQARKQYPQAFKKGAKLPT